MTDSLSISATGLHAHQTWLNALSDNIANINTATSTSGSAFQARYVEVTANSDGSGVSVTGTSLGSATGRLVYDPTNPLADTGGYVRLPDEDLSEQMSDLIMAQRGYQANANVIDRAESQYQAALKIGTGS